MSFSLLEEPWLPVLDITNRPVEIGVRQALLEGASFRQLFHKTPQIEVALLRLLTVILWDALRPNNSAEVSYWSKTGFPSNQLRDYFRSVESRFDLFGRPHPFWQVNELTRAQGRHAWTSLSLTHNKANSGVLYDHTSTSDPPAISAAEAARYLVTDQMFTPPSGILELGYSVAAPTATATVVTVSGCDLHETLCLNLTPVPDNPDDLPVWRRDYKLSRLKHESEEIAEGVKHALTPLTRAVKLHPQRVQGRPFVRVVSYARGFRTKVDGLTDPMLLYEGGQEAARPLRFRPMEPAWRRLGMILRDDPASGVRRAQVIEHALAVRRHLGGSDGPLAFVVYGLVTEHAKIISFERERLQVAGPLLHNAASRKALLDAINYAEAAVDQLDRKEWDLINQPRGRKREKRRTWKGALAHYSVTAPEVFRRLTPRLRYLEAQLCADAPEAAEQWRKEVRAQVLSSWYSFAGGSGASPRCQAETSRMLVAKLNQLDQAYPGEEAS